MNQSKNLTNNYNTTKMEKMYQTKEIYDKLPPDAYVVFIGIIVFVILIFIRRRYKQKKLRQEMLENLEQDMDAMRNIARASKLTAEEYKALYQQAKERVNNMDFSKYEKRKKRKQKWSELVKKEKQQKKRNEMETEFDKMFEKE